MVKFLLKCLLFMLVQNYTTFAMLFIAVYFCIAYFGVYFCIAHKLKMMEIELDLNAIKECPQSFVLAVNDAMNVLTGKWKLPIMASLIFGKKRFKEIEREIPKITPRMLSKELRELELNGIIKRTVHDSIPVVIEYEFTPSGRNIKSVLDSMVVWGLEHRKAAFNHK